MMEVIVVGEVIYSLKSISDVELYKAYCADSGLDVCCRCGCHLTKHNRSSDSHLCRLCFNIEMAEIEAHDIAQDSMTDDERLADFLG